MSTTLLDKPNRAIPTAPDPPTHSPSPPNIQIGDWIVFADGITHRVADRFNWDEGIKRISTAPDGKFYVSMKQRYFTGNQYQSIEASSLSPTLEFRQGQYWSYQTCPSRKYQTLSQLMPFQVWTCNLPCPPLCLNYG